MSFKTLLWIVMAFQMIIGDLVNINQKVLKVYKMQGKIKFNNKRLIDLI